MIKLATMVVIVMITSHPGSIHTKSFSVVHLYTDWLVFVIRTIMEAIEVRVNTKLLHIKRPKKGQN